MERELTVLIGSLHPVLLIGLLPFLLNDRRFCLCGDDSKRGSCLTVHLYALPVVLDMHVLSLNSHLNIRISVLAGGLDVRLPALQLHLAARLFG